MTTPATPELSKKLTKDLAAMEPPAYEAAVQALVTHECRKARVEHPKGTFDNGKRWYPSKEEEAVGTFENIRSPSRSWPNSYNQAARSLAHCEKLAGADHEDVLKVKRVAKALDVDLTDRKAAEAALEKVYANVRNPEKAQDVAKAEKAPEPEAPQPAKTKVTGFPSMADAAAYIAAKREATNDLAVGDEPRQRAIPSR